MWEQHSDHDEDNAADYDDAFNNNKLPTVMNIKLVPDAIQLNLVTTELIESNYAHHRKSNILPGIGAGTQNVSNLCPSSNLIKKSTLVFAFWRSLTRTIYVDSIPEVFILTTITDILLRSKKWKTLKDLIGWFKVSFGMTCRFILSTICLTYKHTFLKRFQKSWVYKPPLVSCLIPNEEIQTIAKFNGKCSNVRF